LVAHLIFLALVWAQKKNQMCYQASSNMDRNGTKEKNNEPLTKAICNKGYSGISSILLRSNFCVGGQESSPQSLTAYSLDR